MYAKCLSTKTLPPPVAGGGLWRTWCMPLFTGIRQHPPEAFGGANCCYTKELNNIRHPATKRRDTVIVYGGLQKKIYEHDKQISKNIKKTLTHIRSIVYVGCMTIIRETIIARMNELNLNPNRLSVMLKDKIPRQTIYDFLSGKTDARTGVVAALMKALGLELKPIKKRNKKKAR